MDGKGMQVSVLDNLTDDDWYKLQLRVIRLEEQDKMFSEFASSAALVLSAIGQWIERHP